MQLPKKLRTLLFVLLTLTLLLLVGAYFVSGYLEKRIKSILLSRNINVSSVNVSILTRSIELIGMELTVENETLPEFPHHLTSQVILFDGISLYQMIANKKIHLHKIVFEDGVLQFNRNLKMPEHKTEGELNFNGFSTDRIVFKNIVATIGKDSIQEYQGTIDLSLIGIQLDSIQQAGDITRYGVESAKALITNVSIGGKRDLYKTSISRIFASSTDKKIEIDSVVMTPRFAKYEFSRKVGQQVDRMNLIIPKISLEGLSYNKNDTSFHASLIEIKSGKLHVFRDKRVPFLKVKTAPLPIALIRDFKTGMSIDSIKLIDATISYEEFPEKGFRSGQITFEKLNATLDHLTNRNDYPDYEQATLKASSYFMGKGLVNAEFSLPYGKAQVYNAKGTLKSFSLYRLNPMLENVAFVSIESGRLNQLTFNFDYTDLKSTGTVIINYEDLKLNSLTKEKNPEKNEFKSLVVNALLKKDKDGTVEKEKRMGNIDFERDKRRAVFHYWWKSVLSGLKSSVIDSQRKREKDKEQEKDNEKKDQKK